VAGRGINQTEIVLFVGPVDTQVSGVLSHQSPPLRTDIVKRDTTANLLFFSPPKDL
jgi:hypothetical protein